MPGKIKVKILAGRNLPVMDRSGDTTDAYVEIKFGNTTYKTDVCRKSLNPQWNSEWYRFEVDDAELQDEPLQVRLMDHDTYSANDAIGKVYVNLNPLLLPGSPLAVKNIWTLEATMNSSSGAQGGSVMTGWIPVFDTMHGIRGEVNIIVKVELFSDCNKFRQSSCGVQFFYSPNIPHGYHAQVIHGFVEELVVSDDPEYKWIDKIRTPRASNEARQTLFFKLSGEVQRKIGLKALDLGGNAVIGYVQNFDLEGESGIVARGIGTAVTLVKLQDIASIIPPETSNVEDDDSLPLLANSPNHSPAPRSPINIRATTLSQRFPKYEKSTKHHQRKSTIRVAEYRAAGLRARQFSLQSSAINNSPLRKAMSSSLSLADDLISESSLKNMLALEDMRGEPAGNPFSRGFKNFRYLQQNILPKRVAQIKSRITDSFDDESDQDSNYSSTWSLAGSESNRSSIAEIRQSMRKKKFTHKKIATNDGIAALLIRSVHSGFPLDSVIEDRETPAPSPVSFIGSDTSEYKNERSSTIENSGNSNLETGRSGGEENLLEKQIALGKNKLESKYTSDMKIPMISSSESDTSTSEDDDPSESSTNYNILDESYSLIDPSSPDDRKYFKRFGGSPKDPGIQKICDDPTFVSEPPLKINDKSYEVNAYVVNRDNDDSTSFESRTNRSMESSTDYNILDDTSSLLETNFIDDTKIPLDIIKNEKIFDIHESGNIAASISIDRTNCTEETMVQRNLETEREIKCTEILLTDCRSKSSTDYNFLDDTPQSLVDSNLTEDEIFFIGSHRDQETPGQCQDPAFSDSHTTHAENNEQKIDPNADIDHYSSTDEKFPIIVDRSIEANSAGAEQTNESLKGIDDTKNSETTLNGATSIINDNFYSSTGQNVFDDYSIIEPTSFPEINFNPIEEKPLSRMNRSMLDDVEDSILPSIDCKTYETLETIQDGDRSEENYFFDTHKDVTLSSGPNFNLLDGCSMIESVSFPEKIFNPIAEKPREQTNFPVFNDVEELMLPPIDCKIYETLKTIQDKDRTVDNCSFVSQVDLNLDSSTDFNVLEDTGPLSAVSSSDEKKSDSTLDSSIESKKSLEIVDKLILPLEQPKVNENIVSPRVENFIPPFSTKSPINCSNEEKFLELSAEQSQPSVPESPPNAKLRHLKFLKKQKHFDSFEDLDFVTSTPVEADLTPPDFSPIDKSPEFSEPKKWDFQPITSIPKAENNAREIQAEGVDLPFGKISADQEKQICPLGVPFEKIVTASDSKVPTDSKIVMRSESTDSSKIPNDSKATEALLTEKSQKSEDSSHLLVEPVRNKEQIATTKISNAKKTQKKVERTDTVIYKGPAKDRDKLVARPMSRDTIPKTLNKIQAGKPSPIPIIVAPPPEEHATRLQVPVIQTTNINVQSTFSPDEMKTQHFGSIGSKKFPIDQVAISEKFSRKYRQHCMLDLIKTIDAKMMSHHAHHERKDSTRSKQRKKRERMNASATPSPDSIHRTRQHRRRSRSRSPDKQHAHPKVQVSTLSTHSFPAKNSSSWNLAHEPSSRDSSSENISKINGAFVVPKDSNYSEKDNTPLLGRNDVPTNEPDRIIAESTLNFPPTDLSQIGNNDPSIDDKTIVPLIKKIPLESKDSEQTVVKSHSDASLEYHLESSFHMTKMTNNPNTNDDLCVPCSQLTLRQQEDQPSSPVTASSVLPSSLGTKVAANATKNAAAVPNMHRRSSDSDLSITPKGNSLAGSDRSMGGHMRPSAAIVRTMNQDTMEMLEYPFITMQQYPPGFVLNIGGLVSARSVKLLERITNLEEPEGRDAWWTEIRMEVRSHARALACNVVLGYKEEISICDDVCVLNASGTAAVISLLNASQDQENVLLSRTIMTTSVESERDKPPVKSSTVKMEKNDDTNLPNQQTQGSGKLKKTSESNDHEIPYLPTLSACSLCHLPYSEASVPFRVDVSKCSICRRAKVPDVLFTTIELPENIPMTGRGVFLQATVCKSKRDLRGELNAKEISDCLPFLEYELHSLLLNKLKVKGMNAIFGLKVQVSVGERLVIGMAVGTAVYLTALPTPSVPQIASGNSWHNEEQLAEIQKTLIETVKKNREFYRLKPIVDIENGRSITTSDTDESDDDLPDLDLGIGTKDACVLEVDDVEDMDRINLLIDEKPPEDFHVVNTQSIPGLEDLEIVRNLQMFTQISRAKIPAGQFASMPSKYFARMMQTVLFKLRRMVPCALCDMQFQVALPEQDEIQLSVIGMALGLGEPTRLSKYKRKLIANSTSKDPVKKTDENDLIFSLDEDQADVTSGQQETMTNQTNINTSNASPLTGLSAQKHRPRSPFRTRAHIQHRHKHVPLKERYGVDITPLSYLPGGKIERYLGNLNFFFIRESTSIRENGGLSGFTHSFVTEILAIVRAHITALGGNAMVAFFMTQCVLLHSPHKNQGQCLINVGGDVVTVSYYGDEKYQGNQNC